MFVPGEALLADVALVKVCFFGYWQRFSIESKAQKFLIIGGHRVQTVHHSSSLK
jgi:exo-beta-1,3-glucanase (GH17 family)